MTHRYLLILGPPRSGTTLLASMVGSHPDVGMLIEDQDFAIRKLVGRAVAANKLCIPNQIELHQRATLLQTGLRKLGFALPSVPTSRRAIADYLALKGVRILGITRNGNAVISSIMRRGGQTFDTAAHRWCRAVEILTELKERHAEITRCLRYEHLVTQPERTMREVCEFIDLPFAEVMLEGYRQNPIYPDEISIDPDRAERHLRENVDFELETRFPEAVRRHNALVR